ncbi:MAG TPA: AMP-binding protein [Acidimicrobiales bacterium]|nr:AMP-binding protein [Acidimicrobiales bacterium]
MKVPLTVADFLFRGAALYPDRLAVVDEPDTPGSLGSLSYRDLDARARGLALVLDSLGIEAGGRVAIVSPNATRFQIAYFGVSGWGRTLVPINYRLNAAEIGYIVEHAKASVLLIDPASDEELADVKVEHRFVLDGVQDAELFNPAPEGAMPREWVTDEDSTASINYTSGTTARPKGVQLTHRNIWLNAAIFGWQVGVSDRDVFMHTLPMFHCNGWGMPYAVTGMGVPQVIVRKIVGEDILQRIETHGVTLLCGAPAVLAAILEAATARRERGLSTPGRDCVRMVVAGAPPPSKTIERLETDLGWEFIQLYGLTETTPLLTLNRTRAEWDGLEPSRRARLLSRAGPPALGIRVQVAEDGEILARGNHVFAGYLDQPDETAKALADGWFHTGDQGYIEDGTYVVIADRKKDVIITGGENVSSVEVEDCLYQHPAVSEAAVIGVPDEHWGETVKALVVLANGSEATEGELISFCRERLAHFKCPTSVDFRAALARTATGKLQKFKLREPFWQGSERRVN